MRKAFVFLSPVVLLIFLFSSVPSAFSQNPIIIGAPLSTAYLYGWGAERGLRLAVEEINAEGGVDVGGVKRPFRVEVIDTRDLEPGVPVSEALLAMEKLILEKQADFIVGGPVRSEAALAAMPLLSRHKKVSILTTGVLTPRYHAMVAEEYDKYKYCFRIHGEAGQLVREIIANFIKLREDHGLKRIFVMVQDVAHARGAGEVISRVAAGQGFEVLGVPDSQPGDVKDIARPFLHRRPLSRHHGGPRK